MMNKLNKSKQSLQNKDPFDFGYDDVNDTVGKYYFNSTNESTVDDRWGRFWDINSIYDIVLINLVIWVPFAMIYLAYRSFFKQKCGRGCKPVSTWNVNHWWPSVLFFVACFSSVHGCFFHHCSCPNAWLSVSLCPPLRDIGGRVSGLVFSISYSFQSYPHIFFLTFLSSIPLNALIHSLIIYFVHATL